MNKTQELMKRIEVYLPLISRKQPGCTSIFAELLCEAYYELERLSEGNFTKEEFNNLCHNKKPVTRCEFEEADKLYDEKDTNNPKTA